MKFQKLTLAAVLAAAMGGTVVPAYADIFVRVAPPEMRVETVPDPRPGYIWVNGHWDWRNNRHEWVRGTWLRERHGYVYNPSHWDEREGQWRLDRGGWHRADHP